MAHWLRAMLLAAVVPGAIAHAQSTLAIGPENCVFRAGDEPGWASPALDESQWQSMDRWPEEEGANPHFWLRCRFTPARLDPNIRPVLVVAGDMSYEVFLNGNPAGASGNLQTGAHVVGTVANIPIAADALARPILAALRITFSSTLYGQQPQPRLWLGDLQFVEGRHALEVQRAVGSQWALWSCYVVIALAAVLFLVLYAFDRSQTLFLWAGFAWLGYALVRACQFLIAASIPIPPQLELLSMSAGSTLEAASIPFFFSLAGRRISPFFKVLLIVNLAQLAPLVIAPFLAPHTALFLRHWHDSKPVGYCLVPLEVATGLVPIAAFWPVWRIPRSQALVAAVSLCWGAVHSLYMLLQFPAFPLDPYFFLHLQTPRAIAGCLVVVALALLLVQQFRNSNRQSASLAAELHAAGEVQRVLVRAKLDVAPGLLIDAVFHPAREVGGDFYRCRVVPDGSQRILIGDVSGKGTAAAMTAFLLLGAAEGHDADSPPALLAHLNRALLASHVGGFATCLCADLAQDGSFAVANAGHLAPYRNGEELALAPDLPLGLVPTPEYPTQSFQMEPGDRLTFLSDGVTEARSPSGELFGFDRTREISTRSADEIAHAAQIHGQSDDITVLTLAYAPIELAHA